MLLDALRSVALRWHGHLPDATIAHTVDVYTTGRRNIIKQTVVHIVNIYKNPWDGVEIEGTSSGN